MSKWLHFKYSVKNHLERLHLLCILRSTEDSTGIDDELSPFSQSVELAEELERQGHRSQEEAAQASPRSAAWW